MHYIRLRKEFSLTTGKEVLLIQHLIHSTGAVQINDIVYSNYVELLC